MPATQAAAVATAQLPADETIVAAPFCDQPLQVEHCPALPRGAVRGELVVVLVPRAESVERDHCGGGGQPLRFVNLDHNG